jgi:hypothetical protein
LKKFQADERVKDNSPKTENKHRMMKRNQRMFETKMIRTETYKKSAAYIYAAD